MVKSDKEDKDLTESKIKKDKEKKGKKNKEKAENDTKVTDKSAKESKLNDKKQDINSSEDTKKMMNPKDDKEIHILGHKDSVLIDIPDTNKTKLGPIGIVRNFIKNQQSEWITKDIAASLGRDLELKLILRDIVFFCIFLSLVTIVCIGNISKYDFHLTRALKLKFDTYEQESIDAAEEFWKYLEETFVGALYTDMWYGRRGIPILDPHDKKVLHENLLVGPPRIKQVKVRNDSCIIHKYFAFAFFNCYGAYTIANEDTEPFGLRNGTAWIYHSAKEIDSPKNKGKISTYGGGGYYLDLSLEKSITQKMIQELKQNLWVRRSTRCVTVDFTLYNGNLNLFCIIGLLFEFPPTGGILASNVFTTVKIIRYFTVEDYLILACEILIACFVIYFTIEEIRDISYLRWDYFKEFWSYIDLSIIATGYLINSLSVYRFISLEYLKTYHKHPEKYSNLEYLGDLMVIFNNASAALLFLVYIKIFKFINFNRTMGQLNVTLSKCKYDVAGFSIMFAIIFIAFAALGYLLFGTEAEDFNDFGYAMLTLLKTILGDFDYKQIERANPVMAPIYFLLFIFLVFFVLLNMFLAIINDTYNDVKTEIALGPQELQMSEVVTKGYFNLMKKLGCKRRLKKLKERGNELTITFEEIKTALKNCGFTDLEIEMFFARYNIDPTVKAGELNVKKLVDELEGKYKNPLDEDEDNDPMVTIDDFVEQQKRLDDIEQTVGKLSTSLQTLLQKLDNLESVRRIRKA